MSGRSLNLEKRLDTAPLDRIDIEGFKSIRKMSLDLRALNVLIGPNGAGKSNLISVFRMLDELMKGNLQLFVAKAGGANALLHLGQKITGQLKIRLEMDGSSYFFTLVPTADDRVVFGEEKCSSSAMFGYKFDFGAGHTEAIFPSPDLVRDAYLLSPRLRSWGIYHFHDTSESALVRKNGAINDNVYLRSDGENLAAFLYRLHSVAFSQYEAIRDTVRLVAPFFGDFVLRPLADNPDGIRLEWREPGSDYPFLAHHLSDGTLRFICLATVLLQPELPATMLIDEPELGLHPYAINVLASLMRSASTRSQLIVSTQSVSLVNQFEPEDLLIAELHNRETVIDRVDPNRLVEWLEDYSLGELWEKNVLGGRPSR